ncbi:inositol polyphosphate multikinase [Neodiprion lecontei]|uniref:Kinase n=1 Tax=Neodiprion lecontei TaxID=441921 RepID=A0A6J0BFG7_NEOLC|nr:inositol polyphosphate multikinase [Neodiprion lecontei]XP_015513146.1 inositol polyphosphate multikinase [Neodiprion lecontei]XP_015513147.1 inositol polyphosphate multikinase [Neodiprion lecontei]XP_046585768.1 inositol polyphosphate multikinase [Neodiprion lecontei]
MAVPQSPSMSERTPFSPGRSRRRNRPTKFEFKLNCPTLEYDLPIGMIPFESQVGGHAFGDKNDTIGMLKSGDGFIYKPIEKPLLGEREIMFYEKLQDTTDPLMLELRQFTPQYYGTKELKLGDKYIKFLILKDLTEGMSEPCVMDVKIGRRTWDPLAGPAKRAGEENKYAESKNEYGFCIPGFQVCRLSTGFIKKYDRDYGKKLDKQMVVEAMELFLNAKPGQPPCRNLIIKLLSTLWKILAFFRLQTKFRFYSSSILLAYDAKRLRQQSSPVNAKTSNNNGSPNANSYLNLSPIARSPSLKLNVRPVLSLGDAGFSGQLTESGPVFEKTLNSHSPIATPTMSPIFMRRNKSKSVKRSHSLKRSDSLKRSESFHHPPSPNNSREPSLVRNDSSGRGMNIVVEKLCRTHSYINNFDKDIIKMKEDYANLLDELTTTPEEKQNWVRVNMIDFAHVFPAENDGLDTNYLEGIQNLIKLLESFLTPE